MFRSKPTSTPWTTNPSSGSGSYCDKTFHNTNQECVLQGRAQQCPRPEDHCEPGVGEGCGGEERGEGWSRMGRGGPPRARHQGDSASSRLPGQGVSTLPVPGTLGPQISSSPGLSRLLETQFRRVRSAESPARLGPRGVPWRARWLRTQHTRRPQPHPSPRGTRPGRRGFLSSERTASRPRAPGRPAPPP